MKFKPALFICLLLFIQPAFGAIVQDTSLISDILNSFPEEIKQPAETTIKTATNKFMQVNIKSARDDFKNIIENQNLSDIENLFLYEKMHEFGLFSIAKIAQEKITDDNFTFYLKCVQDFYAPSKTLTTDEEVFLAEIYSNITYNDRAVEAIKELLEQKKLLKNSDYANYLLALGYYKTNNFKQAMNAVNNAISMNSKCENYKFLKIKLLSESMQRSEAMSLFNTYNNQKNLPYKYRKKCELLKQFILYKTERNQWERNYALGRYYYTEGEYQKALKSLQNASLTKNKKNLTKVWAMMSRTYLKLGQEQKAYEYAIKAYKNDSDNKDCNVTLARLVEKDKDYKKALEYYKKASKDDKLDTSVIKTAQLYEYFDEKDKAKKIYSNLIKKGDDEWLAYYNAGILENNTEYIFKSLNTNPFYKESWVVLIKKEFGNKNYIKAEEYLKNLLYLDEKDYRYYYYKGLILKEYGKKFEAAKYLKKSLELNPENYNVENELLKLKEYI